jgi:hypothetical protein
MLVKVGESFCLILILILILIGIKKSTKRTILTREHNPPEKGISFFLILKMMEAVVSFYFHLLTDWYRSSLSVLSGFKPFPS